MYALFKIKTLSHQDVNHINILVQKHIHVYTKLKYKQMHVLKILKSKK